MGVGQVVSGLVKVAKAAQPLVQEAKAGVQATAEAVEGWAPKATQAAKALAGAASEIAAEAKAASPDRVRTLFQAGVGLSESSPNMKQLVGALKGGRADIAVETYAKLTVAERESVAKASGDLAKYLSGNSKLAQATSEAGQFVGQYKAVDAAKLGTMSESQLKSLHQSLSTAFGTLKNHQSQVSIPGEFREAALKAAQGAKQSLSQVEGSLKSDLDATKSALGRFSQASSAAPAAAAEMSAAERSALRGAELAKKGFGELKRAELEFPQLSMRHVGETRLATDASGAIKQTKVTLEQVYSNAENLSVQVMNTFGFEAGQGLKKWADTLGKKPLTPESLRQFHLALEADLKAAEGKINGKAERQALFDALKSLQGYTANLKAAAERSGLSSLGKTAQQAFTF